MTMSIKPVLFRWVGYSLAVLAIFLALTEHVLVGFDEYYFPRESLLDNYFRLAFWIAASGYFVCVGLRRTFKPWRFRRR